MITMPMVNEQVAPTAVLTSDGSFQQEGSGIGITLSLPSGDLLATCLARTKHNDEQRTEALGPTLGAQVCATTMKYERIWIIGDSIYLTISLAFWRDSVFHGTCSFSIGCL